MTLSSAASPEPTYMSVVDPVVVGVVVGVVSSRSGVVVVVVVEVVVQEMGVGQHFKRKTTIGISVTGSINEYWDSVS